MSEEVLERLVQEVVALRRRVAALETLENPRLLGSIDADTLDGQHGSYYRDILIGMIVPFSGALGGTNNHYPIDPATGQPDTRWHVCNGEVEQGRQTPDLRDRFIIGAGGSYSPGATGGAAAHQHTYTQVPSHSHTMQSAGQHSHDLYDSWTSGEVENCVERLVTTCRRVVGLAVVPAGDHTHAIDAAGVSSPSTNSASSLPPYVALVWLMRVA